MMDNSHRKYKNPYRITEQDNDDDGFGIGFSDTIINFAAIMVVFFVLLNFMLLLHKGKVDQVVPLDNVNSGQISAELVWPNDRDVDIDLWGRAPDGISIGFSNPHGNYLDLVRDVVGFSNNPSHINQELMFGRKLMAGEWTFNASYFGHAQQSNDNPVPVTMIVRIRQANSPVKILTTTYVLSKIGQEKTLFDFNLDEQGNLIQDSVNSRNINIVSGRPK